MAVREIWAGNFEASMRLFTDVTMRPLWRNVSGSLASLVAVPPGAELWYDVSGVAALQSDALDDAEVQVKQFTTMEIGIRSGFDPDTVARAVTSGDTSKVIGNHTNLVSVQLQPPGTAAPTSGNTNAG